ncbi:hypothetical protein L537_4497 [Bordetella hinzii 1277]|nr:hypothetical protein L537_4497 [Bordetella hinzii 1277]
MVRTPHPTSPSWRAFNFFAIESIGSEAFSPFSFMPSSKIA